MKLTNGEIFNSVEPLKKLMGIKLPVKTSLQVAKLVSKLQEPLNEINSVRQGLVKTYGITFEKDEVGITIKSEDEANVPKYLAEMDELGSIETELVIDKVKLPTQVDGKALEIEPLILIALGKFIDVE